MSVIDEVKQRTDIVEVVSQYTNLTKAGRTFRALCPFHSETRPSFFVYPERQSWHCFGACSTGGDVFSFIMKRENIDFGEVLRLLAQKTGVTIPSRLEPDTRKDERERLYQINEAATQYFHNLLLNSPAGEKARHYLASRGFSAKTISDFQLGFSLNSWEALKQYLLERGYSESELLEAGLTVETEEGKRHDRFRHRLMFPIKDGRGHTIGFGARVLDDSLPKYINSPQTLTFDKSGSLYGIDLASPAIRQQNSAVIVEGYLDTITAHQNGFTNVVAAMGTSVTEKQVSLLKKLSRNIVLALDADAAGDEASLRGVAFENILEAEVKVTILPRGKDPDEVIKEDTKTWQQLLEGALPVVDHKFNTVMAKLDLTTARDKSLAVDEMLPIIAEIKDVVRQAHYLQKLARLVKVSERSLEAALRRAKANQKRLPLRQTKEKNQEPTIHPLSSLFSSPLEEHFLALLLQHPELKKRSESLLPEYFENSENREIFTAWQQAADLAALKDKLDTTIWEHLDALITMPLTKSAVSQEYHDFVAKTLPPRQIERSFSDSVIRLRGEYLRNLAMKRAAALALEAETGGTDAELAKLKEEGIENVNQLRDVDKQKARSGQRQRR